MGDILKLIKPIPMEYVDTKFPAFEEGDIKVDDSVSLEDQVQNIDANSINSGDETPNANSEQKQVNPDEVDEVKVGKLIKKLIGEEVNTFVNEKTAGK